MPQEIGYSGKLTIGSAVYQVSSCAVDFNRNMGPDGRPSSTVYGGKIVLSAPMTAKTTLAETMINATNKAIAGHIDIWETGGAEGIFRTITFTNGFIVNYQESFDMNGGAPFVCGFTISAETLAIGTAKLNNNWPINS